MPIHPPNPIPARPARAQICLGARASVTHRGDNLGALVRRNVKSGEHTATALVRVTLLNGGPDAFRPHDYGNSITVEVGGAPVRGGDHHRRGGRGPPLGEEEEWGREGEKMRKR